jgi:putative nucleotidyltransferase with HDIG domain
VSSGEAAHLARLRAEIISAKDIPTIPVLLVHILEVVDGERSSARDLVDVMQRDQALTARVLKLANSGFFGCARQVASLSRAVMLLGFAAVKNVALGVKIWDTLRDRSGPSAAALWEHSALVGTAARLVAQRTRAADPEEAFTAGLLHDIGQVVLSLRFAAVYGRIAATGESPLTQRERAAFGVDHAQAGAWLAEAWSLPEVIGAAIARHHEALAPGAPFSVPVAVNAGNRLVHWTEVATTGSEVEAEEALAPVVAAGLPPEACAEIAALLQGQKDELRAFFGGAAT